jgi:hypothetical protein
MRFFDPLSSLPGVDYERGGNVIPVRIARSTGVVLAILALFMALLFVPGARAQADPVVETPKPMNAIVVSLVVFVIVFSGALVGRAIRRTLPEEHMEPDAKDVIKLATGLVVTMCALVLGMLVSSAKTSYDTRKNEVALMSSEIVNIDRLLTNYGPETKEARDELRVVVQVGIDRIWPQDKSRQAQLRPTESTQAYYDLLRLLAPKNELQASMKAEAITMSASLRQTRWLLFLEAEQSSVPMPLLVILVVWLTVIFASFGIFAPPNLTVTVTLLVCAMAVSAAIFIILEMYTPFSGVLRISPVPIQEALSQIGR